MPYKSEPRPTARFHRWSRKGYAVFSSLHKVIAIGTLTIGCTIVSHPCKAQHRADTAQISKILETDSVVITAQREPVVASRLSRPVQIISQTEIETSPARTVESLLEYIPGVDVRTRGVFGTQSDISIRGGTFDQTLILLNGISMSDPQTGHYSMNLPVDPDAIEKIEVLTGPAARVFGANAYNGVINIITKPADQRKLSVRLTGGEYNLYSGNATLNFSTGKFRHLISSSKAGSDGFTNNTDFSNSQVFLQSSADFTTTGINFQAGWSDRGYGANSFYSPKYPNQYEHTQTYNASVKASTKGRLKLTPAIFWRRNYDRFELFRSDAPAWYKNHNYHRSDVRGASLNAALVWSGGRSSLGGEYRHEAILSNVLGTPLTNPVAVSGEPGIFYDKGDQRELYSLFAEHTLYLGPLTLNAGLLGISAPRQGVDFNIYPGAEAGISITNELHWSAAFNRTLRLPTFTDLYYTSATNVSDPHLKPEEATVWETGLRYRLHRFTAEANAFYRAGRNMIDWVQFPDDEKWHSTNLTEVNLKGFELTLHYQSGAEITEGLRHCRISWQFTEADKSSSGFVSKYVLDNLKHKVDLTTDWLLPAGFSLQLKGSYQQREGTYLNPDDNTPEAYKPVWLADGRLAWKRGKFTLFAEATNLFNCTYTDHANVPQPGRWVRGGIVYQSIF